MTRKKANEPKTSKPKAPVKKAAKPKSATVYVVIRRIPADAEVFTQPDRVFGIKATAQRYADERNRELRALVNPFATPVSPFTRDQEALQTLIAKLGLSAPTVRKRYGNEYVQWPEWWDEHYSAMTESQRDAIWGALNKFDLYEVRETTLED